MLAPFMLRIALVSALLTLFLGCARHYDEPYMLEDPPYIEGHEPRHLMPQRIRYNAANPLISIDHCPAASPANRAMLC